MSSLLFAVAAVVSAVATVGCTAAPIRGPGGHDTSDSGGLADAGDQSDSVGQPDGSGSVIPTGGAFSRVDRVHLYLNLGDSQAAGYNAPNRYGWAHLLYENQRWPDYNGHDLHTVFPSAEIRDQAESGWTSDDVIGKLRQTINDLPAGGDGDDTIVTLGAGGNDFNDQMETIFIRSATESAARNLTGNYNEIFEVLRARYQDSARGRELIVIATNVYDPTDGQVRVPAQFTEGFCETLQGSMINDSTAASALSNLAYFNEQMATVIENNAGLLADHHAIYMGHGMNSGEQRWVATTAPIPGHRSPQPATAVLADPLRRALRRSLVGWPRSVDRQPRAREGSCVPARRSRFGDSAGPPARRLRGHARHRAG